MSGVRAGWLVQSPLAASAPRSPLQPLEVNTTPRLGAPQASRTQPSLTGRVTNTGSGRGPAWVRLCRAQERSGSTWKAVGTSPGVGVCCCSLDLLHGSPGCGDAQGWTGMHRDAQGRTRDAQGCTGGAQGMETLHGAQQEVRANHALLSCGWASTQTLKYKLRKCRSPFTQNSAKYTSHISMSSMISRDSDQYLIQFRHVNYFVCPGACIAMQRFGFWEISGCKSHIHSMENSSPTIQQPPKYNFFPCKAKNTVDHCYEIVFHFLNFTAATW